MDFTRSPYVYEHLGPGQIRILRTVSTIENDPVFGLETVYLTDELRIQTVPLPSDPRIQTVPLSSDPRLQTFSSYRDSHRQETPFDALSYHWGSREGTPHRLNISNGRFVEIHDNLHLALPYLVRRASKLPLWIDAVCINQKHESELASQIKMQSRIYKKAINVWIWLGPVPSAFHVAHAEDATRYISRMDQTIATDIQFGKSTFSLGTLKMPPANSPLLKLIIQILESPWFTRLWIVQECTLATNPIFLFGNLIIEWHHLNQANRRLTLPRHLTDEAGHRIGYELTSKLFTPVFVCRDQYWNHSGSNPGNGFKNIAIMLPFTTRQGSKHPEAKVNALLGFLDEDTRSQFTFGGRTSVRDLYTEFFNVLLCQSTVQRVLFYTLWFAIESKGKSNKGLPSWCPDFDALYRYQIDEQVWTPALTAYTPSRKHMCVRKGDTLSQLIVKGLLFDKVYLIGEAMTDFRSITLAQRCKWWYKAQEWEHKAAQMIVTRGIVDRNRYYRVLFDYHLEGFEERMNPVKVVTEYEYLHLKRILADLAVIVRGFGLPQ